MRIACLQFAPQVGDVNNNLNRADVILRRANVGDLDLLVLPEMAFSGYNFRSLQDISPFLEPSGSGISSLWARTTALKHNCFVVVGYPEMVDASHARSRRPEYYNSAIVVNPDGETVVNYRKTHLYDVDETWALESPKGFYRGHIPELGTAAIGICMDLNPYKFQSPWDSFEFAYHIMHAKANLVVVTMAWLTDNGGRSLLPQEPDMETLTYWATRLEPVIRAEDQDEVIVVFCNRCGQEDEVTYAGTSAVLGIKDGEVCVYGLLGRGDKDLLVVDTNDPPFAKMVLMPTVDDQAAAMDAQSEVIESSESNYPATSPSIDSHAKASYDDHPESFYTQYSAKSSSGRSQAAYTDDDSVSTRKSRPVPPKLNIPDGQKRWNRLKTPADPQEGGIFNMPTPKESNSTPASAHPRSALPFSRRGSDKDYPPVSPKSAGPTYGTAGPYYRMPTMPDSGVFMPGGETPGGEDPSASHRRTKSRASETSRRERSQSQRAMDQASSRSGSGETKIRNTSFTRSQASKPAKEGRGSPPPGKIDQRILDSWFETLPEKSNDSGYYDIDQLKEPSPEDRFSTLSKESLVIAASPSVFQTTFPRPMGEVLAGTDTAGEVDHAPSPAQTPARSLPWKLKTSHSASATSGSPVFSRMMMQDQPSPAWSEPTRLAAPMAAPYPSPAYTEPVKMGQYSIFDLVEENSDVERPPSVILSPVTSSAQPSPALVSNSHSEHSASTAAANDIGMAITTEEPRRHSESKPVPHHSVRKASWPRSPREREPLSPGQAQTPVSPRSQAPPSRHANAVYSPSQPPPTPRFPPGSKRLTSDRAVNSAWHDSSRDRNPSKLFIPSNNTEPKTIRPYHYSPSPSPASFTSSLDTISPGNEVPPTPLDHMGGRRGPPTPKALPLIDDADEDDMSMTPLSPNGPGGISYRSLTWAVSGATDKKAGGDQPPLPQSSLPPRLLDRGTTATW